MGVIGSEDSMSSSSESPAVLLDEDEQAVGDECVMSISGMLWAADADVVVE